MSFVIILITNLIIINGNCFPCTVALNIIPLLNNLYTTVCLYDQVSVFRHINVKSDLNNDDIPVSNEMMNMIHENHTFVYTYHTLRRYFDAL